MFFRNDPFKKTLDALFLWLSGIAADRDAIFVDIPGRNEFFYFDFPLRYGDKPQKTNTLPAGREITFVIRTPTSGKFIKEAEWIKIFSSPEWEMFEHAARIPRTVPLRWRLNEEEKKTALNIARDALEKFLVAGQRLEQVYCSGLAPRFYLKTDLDVVLWVRG